MASVPAISLRLSRRPCPGASVPASYPLLPVTCPGVSPACFSMTHVILLFRK